MKIMRWTLLGISMLYMTVPLAANQVLEDAVKPEPKIQLFASTSTLGSLEGRKKCFTNDCTAILQGGAGVCTQTSMVITMSTNSITPISLTVSFPNDLVNASMINNCTTVSQGNSCTITLFTINNPAATTDTLTVSGGGLTSVTTITYC